MNMFLHGQDAARIEWGDTLNNPRLIEDDRLMKQESAGKLGWKYSVGRIARFVAFGSSADL